MAIVLHTLQVHLVGIYMITVHIVVKLCVNPKFLLLVSRGVYVSLFSSLYECGHMTGLIYNT